MTNTPYTWPQGLDGKPKSLGDMDARERVKAEGSIHLERNKKSTQYLEVKSFLERQAMIAEERLAQGDNDY